MTGEGVSDPLPAGRYAMDFAKGKPAAIEVSYEDDHQVIAAKEFDRKEDRDAWVAEWPAPPQ